MPESNEEIKATLQAVLDDVERNSRIYGYFSSNVTNIAVATIGLTTQVDKLDGRVGRLEELAVETNTRLDKIDGRLDKIDGRLDKVDGRIDKIDGKLENVDTRLGMVEDDVRATRAHVEEIVGWIRRDELKDSAKE